MSPVFAAKLLPRWNTPIDGGRTDAQGNRILGPGKTWRGLVGGGVAGGATALAMVAISKQWTFVAGWDYGATKGTPLWAVFLFGFLLGLMALVGDAVKSYFKRRTGRPRGAPWVPFDQLDFVVFGVATMFAAAPLLANGWLLDALLGDWVILVTLFVLTPLLHFLVNVVGYWLKLKEVPW